MKISNAIDKFLDYQQMNSKKKHNKKLSVLLDTFQKRIWFFRNIKNHFRKYYAFFDKSY